jgi:ATP-dependent Clp protease ATP-binding subunit ClpA
MNMLHNKEMELKNINKTINFQNFIFVFNSNMGFDDFSEEKVNTRRI